MNANTQTAMINGMILFFAMTRGPRLTEPSIPVCWIVLNVPPKSISMPLTSTRLSANVISLCERVGPCRAV